MRQSFSQNAHARSTSVGLALFAAFFSVYLLTAYAAVTAPWYYAIFAALLNGSLIGTLFVIGHDAGHGSLTTSRRLNRLIGRLALLPSLTPFLPWIHSHNYLHHGFTNIRTIDYSWRPLSLQEFRSSPLAVRLLQRAYKTLPGVWLFWICEVWIPHLLFPRESDWEQLGKMRRRCNRDRLLVAAYLAIAVSTCALVSSMAGGPSRLAAAIFLGLIVPYVVWSFWSSLLTLLHHTNPSTVWYNDLAEWTFYRGNVQSTAHITLPFGMDRMFLWIMDHTAHHVDPSIPSYRLEAEQRLLQQDYSSDITTATLTLPYLRRVMNSCQLYDFNKHRWLSFDGTPTSEAVDLTNSATALVDDAGHGDSAGGRANCSTTTVRP